MGVKNKLGKQFLRFDGAMGTMLQKSGLALGELPELYNLTHKELIQGIHQQYLDAGAQIITTNTFGANSFKLKNTEHSVEEVIRESAVIAREAITASGKEGYVALDVGSTGKLMKPLGDLSFEELYDVFKEQVIAGEKAGCDLVLFETFTDLYELKVAVLAAKENTTLPIFATMSFEANGRTFFGTTLESMVLTLEALGVDALGINCSLGPKELMPLVEKLTSIASIPVMLQPNAGLPMIENGETVYNITEDEFAEYMAQFAKLGVSVLGGCCGTTPAYIAKVTKLIADKQLSRPKGKRLQGICSASEVVAFDDVRIIGERLNPTGKKLLQAALRNNDLDYVLQEALKQQKDGAHILDVNVGLPDIDEVKMLCEVVREVQSVVTLPLQIDSSNPDAIEAAVRIYNGKPIINSVCGKEESLERILPIAKKYGAAVLGLTLDETGIPESAEARLEVARKIVERAEEMGIPREDVFIDCLVLTASAQQQLVKETLKAVALVKQELGVKTVLGVSNVSFGLPNRPLLNKTMLAMALMQGLDAPILNPGDKGMLESISTYRVLMGKDIESKDYIRDFGQLQVGQTVPTTSVSEAMTLQLAIAQGLREAAKEVTRTLLKSKSPLEVVEQEIIPALNEVGIKYEKQELFLPQLIKSAETAQEAFNVLKAQMEDQAEDT
ncbi:MAG: homocysteine S-methyltransferase family protein, partial [Cellulosilyticaceae bacterium]